MGSIQKRDRHRWRARYRGPDGRERSRTFSSERDAKDWLALQTVDMRRGDWTDPKLAQVTVGDWGRTWLERKAVRVKPTTLESYRLMFDNRILPDWEHVRLGDVTFHEVDSWVARLSQTLGAASVRKAHVVLAGILDTAVKDGRLSKNPARGVDLPRLPRHEHTYLNHAQVRALAEASGDYRPLILVLAYCGLRFGEAAALRVSNVDPLRRRIRVAHSLTEVRGQVLLGTTKTHAARSVSIPGFLLAVLIEHMAGKGPDDLLFPAPNGGPLRNTNFRRRTWNRAVKAAGVPGLTPHGLRHTAASLAVDSGANVKAVQRMLGHATASMTLDVYADLFDESLDQVAYRLDAAYSASAVASTWPDVASPVVEIRSADGG
jgi:integrase